MIANLGNRLGNTVNRVLQPFGLKLATNVPFLDRVPDLTDSEKTILLACSRFSMASQERLLSTFLACKYVVQNDIPGDFVECGVWRGGNAFLAKKVFDMYDSPRKVWLFDTFTGMTKPTSHDKFASSNEPASSKYDASLRVDFVDWCYASLEDVQLNALELFGSLDGFSFIQGDVTETLNIPSNLPESISVLRLDTDWYESTRKELQILYPRLGVGGVLIIDDYGYWEGARLAVDEYFADLSSRPLLVPVDETGRVALKIGERRERGE